MIYAALFYLIAGLTILCALGVALSQNVVYAAFALMGTLIGAAGIYAFLAADFVAVVQVLVYVGGILVLTLFAIMLTHQISDINVSNRSVGWLPASLLVLATGAAMSYAVVQGNWFTAAVPEALPTTYRIGEAFLTDYLLPFELASVVLLTALIGAVVLSRKELRD
ncbi:MAG: NADH-quinone oxidoreductase subunit J [Candidatus Binatia bacterium]|nr:NADH-quinone oxidoreductase subunit J [Candidatus Binatia bacterium]MDG1957072.1 NADH-quinone oxidoreductase subunit J [Candidatus Binatia bacterium]MDG2011688.1 NADH-quinone oxidoreductase subunit J [Candidatus Binatia bacterium]